MKINIGKTDKIIRYCLALVIIVFGMYYKSWWILLAFVPLATGFLRFCPLYKIFGLSTCGSKSVQ